MLTSLTLTGVAVSYGARPLFAGLDALVAPGQVLALVGPNGAGKSTLLRVAAGLQAPDAGVVRLTPPSATVGYLAQSGPRGPETIAEYVARRTGVATAEASFEVAAADLAHGLPGADDAYSAALDRWLALGGADLDTRLGNALDRVGLGVPPDRPLASLSGGQLARASLAALLVSSFDVLALDEPTNDLDEAGVALVTEHVRRFAGPVLVASHDRALLDEVATGVLEIDPVQQTTALYAGGWTAYREARDLARRQARAARQAYVERRAELLAQARDRAGWAAKGRARIDSAVKERGTPASIGSPPRTPPAASSSRRPAPGPRPSGCPRCRHRGGCGSCATPSRRRRPRRTWC